MTNTPGAIPQNPEAEPPEAPDPGVPNLGPSDAPCAEPSEAQNPDVPSPGPSDAPCAEPPPGGSIPVPLSGSVPPPPGSGPLPPDAAFPYDSTLPPDAGPLPPDAGPLPPGSATETSPIATPIGATQPMSPSAAPPPGFGPPPPGADGGGGGRQPPPSGTTSSGGGKRSRGRTLSVVAAVAILLVGGGTTYWLVDDNLSQTRQSDRAAAIRQIDREVSGPEHLVEQYLECLSRGDARAAWALATGTIRYSTDAAGQGSSRSPSAKRPSTGPSPTSSSGSPAGTASPGPSEAARGNNLLVDNDLYQASGTSLSDVKIASVSWTGPDRATVNASFRLDGDVKQASFVLERAGTLPGGYRQWAFVEAPVGLIDLTVTSPGKVYFGETQVTQLLSSFKAADGVGSGTLTLMALPGVYEVVWVDPKAPDNEVSERIVVGLDGPTAATVG